ncbi:surface-adhesin E family protein [Leptolyngbya sp. FACHB-261]|uniref:surface-adhesin E family protein n=1 Tax=Leptolyngbya sp. FACHB-261 TaxID=2692806 RepID=UPI001686CC12|nr:surface-adhesin E family protein [Leptolyngbya sp. FACHB-261]MBD2104331.1 hypothetical protein [Leptolyngbya sp. FACHB-261]
MWKNVVGLTLVLLIVGAAPGRADWTQVAKSQSNQRFSVNPDSIRRDGRFAWFWFRYQTAYEGQPLTFDTYTSADCTTRQYRRRQQIEHWQGQRRTGNDDQRLRQASAGEPMWSVLERVCAQ